MIEIARADMIRCCYCGNTIRPRKSESMEQYAKRRYCGSECVEAYVVSKRVRAKEAK